MTSSTTAPRRAPRAEREATSPPPLTPWELARWAWRQLTSMRTALVLLLLLAVAAVPGSVIPQTGIDPSAVTRWKQAHPTLTPIYERLDLFAVYQSVWFSAIYLLLMVSLVGCVLPRLAAYWRGMRARPPKPPRNLHRLPANHQIAVDAVPEATLEAARATLRRGRYRVDVHSGSVAAERGYLREAGNLVFHASLLVVLAAVAYGKLFGFVGAVNVVEGETFPNIASQYDNFTPGSLFDAASLEPFELTIDDFQAVFLPAGPQAGQPISFRADATYRPAPTQALDSARLEVNHPLTIGDTSLFLVGHGYAPVVTVRDSNGDIAHKGPVVFLPTDATFNSFGVIKVPDALPEQLGFEGQFLPTYEFTMETGPFSRFPGLVDPMLTMLVYQGDLGIDDGTPQSVFILDKSRMKPLTDDDGKPFRVDIRPGETVQLPDGAGSITFDRVDRFARLQISETPGKRIALGGAVAGLLGLMASLYVRPRRVWVKTTTRAGRTVLEIGGLTRGRPGNLQAHVEQGATRIKQHAEEKP